MVIANVLNTYTTVAGLWQYDYGQILRLQGIKLPTAVEIHFSLQEKGGESVTRIGTTKDGVTDVVVPDSMLENNATTMDYKIYAFVYLADSESGRTEYKVSMSVKSRPKPEGFEKPGDAELFRQAITEVNNSAEVALQSKKEAEAWAHGREDCPDRQKDNAMYYAKTARDEAVAAKTAAETAKSSAESVLKSVKETATTATTYIGNAKTQAITDINQAGTDQKTAVEAEGTKQIGSMDDIKTKFDAASTAATKALEDKKTAATTAIEDLSTEKTTAITTEGTTQKNAVTSAGAAKVKEITDEGAKQKQAITEATDPFLTDVDALQRNNDRINAMLGILAYTDKVYSVDIPIWETTQGSTCIKSDDNAGLVALPSTAVEHRQNDYEDLPWFRTIDVNAIVDDNGIKRITAIKGDDNFSESGSADVFVCGLAYYEKWSDLGNGYMRYSRCFTPREGYELNKLALNLDGSKNPFFLIAKYPLVKGEDGLMHSQPNRRCAYYTGATPSENISMNDSINHMKKRGKYYSLGTYLDHGYIQTTWYLMFGDFNSGKTMNGCTGGHNFQYTASIERDELYTYFPVTNSQANNIEIGPCVSVGYEYVNNSSRATDRTNKQIHQIAMDVKVLKKEAIDDNNTAIYLDCDPFSTTHQVSGDIELKCIMSSMHWRTGFSSDVKGRTGCPCQTLSGLTNRKFPIVFNGIEMQLGFYEVMAGFDIIADNNGTQDIYALIDATKATTAPKSGQAGYVKISSIIPTSKNAWKYITHITFKNGYLCATTCGEIGSGESKGCGDAVFISVGIAGETRELGSFGNLGDRGSCGLLYLNLGSGLGGFGWLIGGRHSKIIHNTLLIRSSHLGRATN